MEMRGRRSHPVSYHLVVSRSFQEQLVEVRLVLLVDQRWTPLVFLKLLVRVFFVEA